MAKITKLMIATGMHLLDIGHRRTGSTVIADDIGHRRTPDDIGHRRTPDDIGHRRKADDKEPLRTNDIHHLRSTLELSQPHVVRRISAFRDTDGNIHLELEE